MTKILIAGALDFSRRDAADFVRYLGEEVIEQGHVLMSGCLNEFDRVVAKPLLPITAFGGAGVTTYNEEIAEFHSKYGDRVDQLEYEGLNQLPVDLRALAKDAVSLAAKIHASKHVFVIMSFAEDPKLDYLFESFKEVCEEFGYECSRVDGGAVVDRIVPHILARIRRSAFVIVDLSEPRPNVYYEFGLAQGLNKPHVVTAYKGTTLPFDVNDVPTIFWAGQTQLKEALRDKIGEIASLQGRR